MAICPRCRLLYESGSESCPRCSTPLLDVVEPEEPDRPVPAVEAGPEVPEPDPEPEPDPAGESEERDRLVLLLEEPQPEMAGMIREFLENCGILTVVKSESLGLLYPMPMIGGPFLSRVFVRESDFQEARELVANFFKRY